MLNQNFIEIDGSYGSGEGAILRVAGALSAVTQKPCRIFNIRKSRPKPGLSIQHLLGIQALAQLCNGRLEGDRLGSEEIKFYPGQIYRLQPPLHPPRRNLDRVSVNIPTAGSITLVLQTLILPALFASQPIKIIFTGGATDTFFSPTIDYFHYVFLPTLEKMNLTENRSLLVEISVLKRGYYPEGGARVEVKVFPSKLKPINLTERGELKKILVISGASNALKNKKVAERQVAGVREVLGKLKLPTEEKIEYYDTQCPGSQICLAALFENTIIGTDNLGKLSKRAEDVGKEAALELLKEQKSQACLDKHLADQVLPYLALAQGKSRVTVSEITNHCKTNIWVIEKFIEGKFEIKGSSISFLGKNF